MITSIVVCFVLIVVLAVYVYSLVLMVKKLNERNQVLTKTVERHHIVIEHEVIRGNDLHDIVEVIKSNREEITKLKGVNSLTNLPDAY